MGLRRRGQTSDGPFNAATAYALTIVLAGLAFTMTTLPNTSRLPALVTGFIRVLIMQSPGMVTLPAFFTSLVAMLARLSKTFDTADLFNSLASARACASWPLDIGLAPAFMAFIAGAMASKRGGVERGAALKEWS